MKDEIVPCTLGGLVDDGVEDLGLDLVPVVRLAEIDEVGGARRDGLIFLDGSDQLIIWFDLDEPHLAVAYLAGVVPDVHHSAYEARDEDGHPSAVGELEHIADQEHDPEPSNIAIRAKDNDVIPLFISFSLLSSVR